MLEEVDLNDLDEHGEPVDKDPDRRKQFEKLYDRIVTGLRMGRSRLSQDSFEHLDRHYNAMDAEQRTDAMMSVADRQQADLLYLYNLRIELILGETLVNVEHCRSADITGLLPEEEVLNTYMAEQRRLQDRILSLQERQVKLAEKKLRVEALWNRSSPPKAKKSGSTSTAAPTREPSKPAMPGQSPAGQSKPMPGSPVSGATPPLPGTPKPSSSRMPGPPTPAPRSADATAAPRPTASTATLSGIGAGQTLVKALAG